MRSSSRGFHRCRACKTPSASEILTYFFHGAHGLIHPRLHHRRFKVALDFVHKVLNHQDRYQLFFRIDPNLGAVGAEPAEASVRELPPGSASVLYDRDQIAEAEATL